MAAPNARTRRNEGRGIGGAVDEHRQRIVAGKRAGELVERNGDAVIDLHGMRQRHVEIMRLQVAHAGKRQLARHPQRTTFEVPVLGGFGGSADAERRHQLIERIR